MSLLLLLGVFLIFSALCLLGLFVVGFVELRAEARAERARRERLTELAWLVKQAEPLWTRDEVSS